MASIKKKNGIWEVRYDAGFDGTGKRIQKFKGGFARKEDAETYLVDMQHSINHGEYIEPDKMFVFEYLNRWLEYKKTLLSPTTHSGYEVNIRCHINPYIGGIRIQELRATHIKDLYLKLQKDRTITINGKKRHFKKLSPTSITYVHRTLSKALEDAVNEDEIINRNPAKAVKPPKSKKKFKASFLPIATIREMLNKFKDDEMFVPVYLAVVLGLRRGEVLGLKWKYVDFENKVVKIREESTMAYGKPIHLDEVKSEDSNRDIIVTDRIIKMLKEHRRQQKVMQAALGIKYHKSDFVCTWPDGELFHPSHISRSFKKRMKEYGLPEIRFHDLRHSNGALMIAANIPMKGASDRLGHSTITITEDFYGHVEQSIQEQIAEKIDSTLWDE